MDTEKLLQAFTSKETGEVAAALPGDVFAAEAARRGFTLPEVAGSLATGGAVQAEAAHEAAGFKTKIGEFVASDTPQDVHEQLATMGEFWQKLGKPAYTLNEAQRARIQTKLDAHPDRRVVPVPLLDLDGQQAIAEAAKSAFPDSTFNPRYDSLYAPDESYTYGTLIRDPEATVIDGRTSYGLLYNTEEGVVNRSELTDKLVEGGQAVQAEDGTVWIFPVMDVRVDTPREYARADKLHAKADITQIPESLITKQLLHQASGTPNPNWSVDFTNEAVYELDTNGGAVAPVDVTGVYWNPFNRQVGRSRWSAGSRGGSFGVCAAESGL